MRKLVNKIMLLLVYLVLYVWTFELLLIIGVFIKDTKYKDIYIFSIVIIISLVFIFFLRRLFFDNKPKFKDWKYFWDDWRVYEGDWDKKYWANWKWKLIWPDWSCYEWEFKDWKPHCMWIIKMGNWYYYEWEFFDWKIEWKFKKQVFSNWNIIEWDFKNDKISGVEWVWKMVISWYIFEWTFKSWKLNWKWKLTTPNWEVLIWIFDNWELKVWKRILKNGEYSEWNWINWYLIWMARYYFRDGSYYEWECKDWNWIWKWTYITKKWERYLTEFPYEIINIFTHWLSLKIKEIHWNLKYTPKSEKEKIDEKNMYLEILKRWTVIQKEIVKLSLEEDEKAEVFLKSLKDDGSLWDNLEFYRNILELHEEYRKRIKKIADKNHIKCSKKASVNSYWKYFYELDHGYDVAIDIYEFFVKFDEFLDSKDILDFIIKREKKENERAILIEDFSDKYNEFIQSCLDWREYDKKFWEHNFKFGKRK